MDHRYSMADKIWNVPEEVAKLRRTNLGLLCVLVTFGGLGLLSLLIINLKNQKYEKKSFRNENSIVEK